MATQIEQLEGQLLKLDEVIKFGDVVERLTASADFRTVIDEGFMTRECARYAQLSADPALTADQRADALGLAQAAGHLKRFLSISVQMASRADQEKISTQQALEEARSEPEDDE